MELVGHVKSYDWGKLGTDSLVAKLANFNSNDFKIENDKPYAELWMGDHVSGPATIKLTGIDFKLDSNVYGQNQLPFLFKVLSIRKALSIQVHPNKSEAKYLHEKFPNIYKDPNHKPELAIALTPFTAMCGFRVNKEIEEFCQKLPPLVELLGKNNVAVINCGPSGMEACFSTLMKSDEETVTNCIKEIIEDYPKVLAQYNLYDLFVKLNKDFPNDVGILCLFFLNVMKLKPGEAIFLGANAIHAYIDGDCVECMACSDNIVRAGLTPKFKDVDTLLRMLDYEGEEISQKFLRPIRLDSCAELYVPKVKDFAVAKINIPTSKTNYKWANIKYDSIMIVLSGKRLLKSDSGCINLKEGSIIYIPTVGTFVEFFKCLEEDENEDEFRAFIAMYNCF